MRIAVADLARGGGKKEITQGRIAGRASKTKPLPSPLSSRCGSATKRFWPNFSLLVTLYFSYSV